MNFSYLEIRPKYLEILYAHKIVMVEIHYVHLDSSGSSVSLLACNTGYIENKRVRRPLAILLLTCISKQKVIWIYNL